MASWHENRYHISMNNVNLNEHEEIALDGFQGQSERTNFYRSNRHLHQHQSEAQLSFANGCIVSAGVVPSMLLMERTVSFPEIDMEPRSRARENGEEMMDRKQKRLIKNRESAARSRDRKLAYRNELERKIICLEEEINRLKQQKEEASEKYLLNQEAKGAPLRRSNSGPY